MTTPCTLLLAVAVSLGPAPSKKLIEWGWGSPNTRQFREQIDLFEKSPFDGIVITAIGQDGDKPINLAWEPFGTRAFKREHFAEAVKDLQATKRHRFTECFLRFNNTPGGVDFLMMWAGRRSSPMPRWPPGSHARGA